MIHIYIYSNSFVPTPFSVPVAIFEIKFLKNYKTEIENKNIFLERPLGSIRIYLYL